MERWFRNRNRKGTKQACWVTVVLCLVKLTESSLKFYHKLWIIIILIHMYCQNTIKWSKYLIYSITGKIFSDVKTVLYITITFSDKSDIVSSCSVIASPRTQQCVCVCILFQELMYLCEVLPNLLYRDFLRMLPTEVSVRILMMLDEKSLLNCCLVSKWVPSVFTHGWGHYLETF